MDADTGLLERVSGNLEGFNQSLAEGRAQDACVFADLLLEDLPQSAEAWYWKASALIATGDDAAALGTLNIAVRSQVYDLLPALEVDIQRFVNDAMYNVELSRTAYDNKLPTISSIFGMQAISLGVQDAGFQVHHGLSFQHQGRMDEAFNAFRTAVQMQPAMAYMQFYLYACFFMPNGFKLYAQEARAWADRFCQFPTADLTPRPLAGRRLRIGYVAPSILTTQLRQFLTPVLESHDPARVEVILYVNQPQVETGLPCARMVATGGMSDEALADLIRKDEIDVLIDTWGHTAGSRLGVFARRAAPVQVAWINFVQTTGLKTMDYVLHSDSMAAPGTAELFTETIWPMGDITIPYRPAMARTDPTPTPALATGVVTFASFNHPAKFGNDTIKAWARILKGCPDSVLLLKYQYFNDPVLQRVFRARFQAWGIDPARVVFEGFSLGAEYVQSFARIDLALDPSPCPGGTTTCDAMANGVPVLTLAGPDFYSRIGIQVVATAGFPELVANSWDDYVDRAVALGNDLAGLQRLRERIRPAFDAGPLRDEKGFTQRLEAAFIEMTTRAMAAQVA